jgi:hypothetical protein
LRRVPGGHRSLGTGASSRINERARA